MEEVANQIKGFQNLAEILVAQIKAMEERQNKKNNRLTKESQITRDKIESLQGLCKNINNISTTIYRLGLADVIT